ncbi:MAG: uroporphyrinogen decarboxylase family protein [Candidatus Omnitrophica bacterium]|nr:uroporphyrinogen decarboxylase family protein [Candidatus Omnitrophota bacterium]
MNPRKLWLDIMFYQGHDRMPVIHWTQWPETTARWHQEGWPEDVDIHTFLKTSPHWAGLGVNLNLFPPFEPKVLEETKDYRIVRGSDGVVQQEWKNKSCIPHYIDFTLKSASDWPAFKKRLQPDKGRIPSDLDKKITAARVSDLPVVFSTASLMGWIRNWMGVVNMSYLMYDSPRVFADMVMTLADLTCWAIDQVLPRMPQPPDMGFGWEDICGKAGPLVSPVIFRKYVAPGYLRIREKLESYGVRLLGIDSDGDVRPLIGEWLRAGVNVQFPIEIGTWQADPYQIRQQFGRELRIIGGFNKLALEKGPEEIDAEIARRLPLMKEGGFILMPDHLITPGTSLSNYRYFLDRMRSLRF